VKLLVFSDIHNDKRALERLMAIEADAYVCAGDLVSWARGLDAMGEILKPRAERIYVLPGNHESEADIAAFCARFGFTALHGRAVELGGVQVAGLGYSNRTPFDTPGEYSEPELSQRLEAFVGLRPLVLVCHCPPKETPLDRVREGAHFGSPAVREFIEKHGPARFFSGHIHETEGVECTVGRTRGVNAGKRGYLLDLAALTA
jgi:Icc-related predicted phosphoesterase